MMKIRQIFLLLILILINQAVVASGTRSTDVSAKLVENFPLLSIEQLPVQLHYIGSTDEHHIFMTVKTAFAKGRPFDHLFSYRYPLGSLEINNGWKIPNRDIHVRPMNCPSIPLNANLKKITLPDDEHLRRKCLPGSTKQNST